MEKIIPVEYKIIVEEEVKITPQKYNIVIEERRQ